MGNFGFSFGNFGFGNSSSGSSSLYGLIGEYNNIRSGAYYKALKSYYGTNSAKKTSSSSSDSNSKVDEMRKKQEAEETQKSYSTVKSKASDLTKNAAKLTTTGKDSLFVEKEMKVKDEKTGEEKTVVGIDEKAIRSAVKDFVTSYNDTLKAANATGNSNVIRNAEYMTNQTNKFYSKALAEVGISINADNTLSVDSEKLDAAKTDNLKKLFNGSASFANFTSQKASTISSVATLAASSSSLYNSQGSYQYSNAANSLNWYL